MIVYAKDKKDGRIVGQAFNIRKVEVTYRRGVEVFGKPIGARAEGVFSEYGGRIRDRTMYDIVIQCEENE